MTFRFGFLTHVQGRGDDLTRPYRNTQVEAGDHTIVLLRLHAANHVDRSLPLVFHRSGFGLSRSA